MQVAVFAVRLDTVAKYAQTVDFHTGGNAPTALNVIGDAILSEFPRPAGQGEANCLFQRWR